jgi:hypothetical protein
VVAFFFLGYGIEPPLFPAFVIFVGMMLSVSSRNVAVTSLTTRIPHAHERAEYMSLQSAVQHLSAAGGAFLSTVLLSSRPDGHLAGMTHLGRLASGLSITIPFLLWKLEPRVKRNETESMIPLEGIG